MSYSPGSGAQDGLKDADLTRGKPKILSRDPSSPCLLHQKFEIPRIPVSQEYKYPGELNITHYHFVVHFCAQGLEKILFFPFYHLGNMFSDEKSFAQRHLVAFVADRWINAWLDQSFLGGFGRGPGMQPLPWMRGVLPHLEEGGRLNRGQRCLLL